MGLRGTASSSYVVEDVFVPEAFSATREDMRAVRTPGKLYSFSQMGLYSVGCAAVALGIARAMLDGFVAVASSKTPRGIAPLAQIPSRDLQLAQTEARLAAARAFLAEALGEAWAMADPSEPLGLAPRARVARGDPRPADRGGGRRLRLQGRRHRRHLRRQRLWSAASATCTRSASRSRRASPISSRSGRCCSARSWRVSFCRPV